MITAVAGVNMAIRIFFSQFFYYGFRNNKNI